MPTATGKTVVFCEWIRLAVEKGWRVLILTHREEILEQAVVRLFADTGIRAKIEKAERRADPLTAQVVAASVQTISQPRRLGRWDPDYFQLIVLDECHHATSKTWLRVVEHFASAKICGVTATPDRMDCKSLLEIFETVAYEMSIRDAIDEGWIVPIRQRFVRVEGLDYTQVGVVARDLNQGDLDSVLRNAEILQLMAEPTISLVGDRKTIVFAVTIAHAHALVKMFRALGTSAEALDKDTPKQERSKIIEGFRGGAFQFLINVGIVSEGFDCPSAAAIAMMRPTMSRPAYAQQIGRGFRVLPDVIDRPMTGSKKDAPMIRCGWIATSPKPDVMVLDFVGNSGRHKLVHTAHVIEPEANERVTARADELLEANPLLTTDQAVQLAFEQIAEEDTRTALEREAEQTMSKGTQYELEEVDPFDETDTGRFFSMLGLQRQPDLWERAASEKQVVALRKFGIEDPDRLSLLDAKRLMSRLIMRAQQRKATIKQVRKLIQAGTIPANAMQLSFARASQGIQELADNGWKRPDHWGPRANQA